MGLIKAFAGAVGGVLADQWRDYFYCESLDADTLAIKGTKRIDRRSSNTKGSDNIISNGSIIAVNEGQFMLIADQGKVVEFCDEPGEYIYDTSTEPSLFYGSFGKGLLESFKLIGKRFTFGGEPARDQRVYYFNKKEIMGNKYGTPDPVPFRVVDKNIGLDIDVSIRCYGEYSYKITDPLIFYSNVCGNVAASYKRSSLDSQLKTELMTALQPAFAKISAMGIRYSALPGHTMEISEALNEVLSEKWSRMRGISVASFGISSISVPEEDEQMIKNLQRAAVLRDPGMAAATLAGAQAEAMKYAAQNESAGPVMAFAGMNMANAAGGMNAAALYQMGQAQAAQSKTPEAPGWKCECGYSQNTGKFCAECGKPQPTLHGWNCSTCGAFNKGKFCSECGAKKPEGALVYKCNKCGWEPEDKSTPPKFCPECGDRFDEADIQK